MLQEAEGDSDEGDGSGPSGKAPLPGVRSHSKREALPSGTIQNWTACQDCSSRNSCIGLRLS